jgi:hypothetical protein
MKFTYTLDELIQCHGPGPPGRTIAKTDNFSPVIYFELTSLSRRLTGLQHIPIEFMINCILLLYQ